MALDLTKGTEQWRQVIEIALDSGTVRYAFTDLALDDGTYYSGRIRSMPVLRRSAGGFLDPRIVEPRLSIALDNADMAIRDSFDSTTWGNRTVTVKVGQGTAAADYETVYTGSIAYPAGMSWDELEATIVVRSNIASDARSLPINKFNTSTYPNIETKSQWLPIPIVYGDWLQGSGSGERVPCFCINTSTRQFKIADHAIKRLEAVYLNGASVAFSSTDLANATFILDVAYDPELDVVSANIQGATDDGTSGGNLLVNLADIFDDILQTWLGVASSKIDATALASWNGFLSRADDGRRVISAETSSNTLLSELLVDGFADIRVADAKYAPRFRALQLTGLTTLREFDILDDSPGKKQFSVEIDPQRVYGNEMVGDYSFDPITGRYNGSYEKEVSAEIAAKGARVRRRIKLNWIYKEAGAQARTEREAVLFGQDIEMPTIGFGPRALELGPTDQFRLTYNKWGNVDEGTPFQVRDVVSNYQGFTAKILAWNLQALATYGTWTADAAPDWSSSNNTQRETQGYWTNASGEADSGNSASIRSIWF